ncbi:MAG TPA: hypothetical protein VGZ25_07375 [Gemmataceae bacterium]|jgi:hypothetical protein|nr:hypothetical protein [Gemmataceae bacterium]
MKCQCSIQKTGGKKFAAPKAKAGDLPPNPAIVLLDNEDQTFTVAGVDAAGKPLDISALATMTDSSADPTILTVDAPVGMASAVHTPVPPKDGSTSIAIVVTANDASFGPFNLSLAATVDPRKPVGAQVSLGPITSH